MRAELLKGGRLATTEQVTWRGRLAVRKTLRMQPRIPLLSVDVDRWLAGRECRQLKRAEGIDGVPRLLARPAPNVFLREWVPGTPLGRGAAPAALFYDRLLAAVRALHARGVVHNDLHKEANVIVRPDGTPGLLDFQLSLTLPRGSFLGRLLERFDVYHVLKNRRHRTGVPPGPEGEEYFATTNRWRALHRALVKKPMNVLTRRLFPRALGKLPTDSDP